jgi:hypothetical protein
MGWRARVVVRKRAEKCDRARSVGARRSVEWGGEGGLDMRIAGRSE